MQDGSGAGLRPVRVLIVDDSPTMRRLIRLNLAADRRIAVVGEAGDPHEARAQIKALSPDVITLDIEMPQMDGLEFLARLMRLRPMPVVMLSSLTPQGSRAAIEALALGAFDCIGKPGHSAGNAGFAGLAGVIVAAAGSQPRQVPARSADAPVIPSAVAARPVFRWNGRIVLIGASTGGVEALERVLSGLPADGPPVLVTQHMSPAFLASFSQRLDERTAPKVALATEGAALRQGQVLVAPGGDAHLEIGSAGRAVARLVPGEACGGHRPSVDRLMLSAAGIASRIVAVLLTGMGRDGADGMAALRAAGAQCLAQDQATSVVWGMPRAAIERGAVSQVLPLDRMASEILRLTNAGGVSGTRS